MPKKVSPHLILQKTDIFLTRLLELSLDKTQAIVEHDTQKILDIVSEEKKILAGLRQLSSEAFAGEKCFDSGEVSKIREKEGVLRDSMEKNRALLKQCLGVISRELEFLCPGPGYGGKPSGTPLVLDIKM